VEGVGDQGGGRPGGEDRIGAVHAARGERDPGGEQREEPGAEQPQLGERLDRQRVGVAGGAGLLALAQPLDGEAAGPDARERMVGEGADRDAPVLVAG
jgi:hypothetical protein